MTTQTNGHYPHTNGHYVPARDFRPSYSTTTPYRPSFDNDQSRGSFSAFSFSSTVQNQTPVRQEGNDTLPKRPFKILNELERAGLMQKMDDLQTRLRTDPTNARLKYELANVMLMEIRSCYQVTKDAFHKTKQDHETVKTAEANLQAAVQARDAQLALLRGECNDANNNKRKLESEVNSLRADNREKKRTTDEIAARMTSVQQQHAREMAELQKKSKIETLALQQQLQGTSAELKQLKEEYDQRINRHAKSVILYEDKLQTAKSANETLELHNKRLQTKIDEQERKLTAIAKIITEPGSSST